VPNESRLSCGRKACWRAAGWFGWRGWSGAQMAFYPTWAPVSFKRLLGRSQDVSVGGVCLTAFGARPAQGE